MKGIVRNIIDEKNNLLIDFDRIKDIALLGVRRATVFMGLGLNSGLNSEFRDYELTQYTQFQLVPPDLPDETIKNFKDEYCKWIVTCGLRELVETFCVFLDGLYHACAIIKTKEIPFAMEQLARDRSKFNRKGLQEKLIALEKQFTFKIDFQECLPSIQRVRNCLVHRRGIVSGEDCIDGDQQLTVQWLGLRIWAEEPDGTPHELSPVLTNRLYFPNGGIVKSQSVIREKVFPMDSVVEFMPHEIAEICWFFTIQTHEFIKTALTYSDQKEIPRLQPRRCVP